MIFRIRVNPAGYAEIHCPPKARDLLHDTTAVYDPDRKRWLLETRELTDFTRWLRDKGHTPIVDEDRTPPTPPPYQRQHVDWEQQRQTNTRGVAACRAALANAPHQGAP